MCGDERVCTGGKSQGRGTGSAGEKAGHGEASKQGQRARHQEKLGPVSLASDLRMGQWTYQLTFSL